jgi:hypothetical protein
MFLEPVIIFLILDEVGPKFYTRMRSHFEHDAVNISKE